MMKKVQSNIAVLCALLISAPLYAQQQQGTKAGQGDAAPRLESEPAHWYSPFTRKYDPEVVPPINVSNSSRLDSLLREGTLYLSLQDAIALALENNIDIEVQRYGFLIAQQNLKAADAGGAAGNVSTGVAGGAASAGAPGGGAGLTNAGGGSFVSTAGGVGGGGFGGTSIPNLDPVLTGNLNWGHITQVTANSTTTGLLSPVNVNKLYSFGVSKGFLTGTTTNLTFNNQISSSNSPANSFNPSTSSYMDLQITQHLLQGFGLAINNRNIRVAKNNLRVTDYTFEQQVISTVSNVIQLYWNLVSFTENVNVEKQALAYSEKLLDDNKKQVEIGMLAPVEVTRAEAEVAADQQNLLTAQTNVLQQEVILKNALSRNGTASLSISEAHIVPTDHIRVPDVEPVRPIQDLISEALAKRPDLSQTRIQLDNSKINLQGTRNAMLPSLDLVADARNNALAGSPNPIINPRSTFVVAPDPFFVGGYGTVLNQLFGRNFPNYSVGLQLNIPLRNRAAQANMANAQLQLRQSELQVQKSINQIRQDVQTALIALQQARARHDAAGKNVVLEEQLLDAEQKKFSIGTSTPFQVISVQRDLANARLAEVQALTAYGLAQVQLDQAIGTTIENNHIQLSEARSGRVSTPPSPIPDVNNNAASNGGSNGVRPANSGVSLRR